MNITLDNIREKEHQAWLHTRFDYLRDTPIGEIERKEPELGAQLYANYTDSTSALVMLEALNLGVVLNYSEKPDIDHYGSLGILGDMKVYETELASKITEWKNLETQTIFKTDKTIIYIEKKGVI